MYKVFISHSSKDKAIVDVIVDELLENGMDFKHDDIFYTSGDSMGIKTGEEWRKSIKTSLLDSEVILLILTPNYKESEICINEMGAAWATHEKVIPIVVPSITFSTIGVTFDVMQGIKLTDNAGLDSLRDKLHEWTSTQPLPTPRWSAKREEAKITIESIIKENPFKLPMSRDTLFSLEKEAAEAKDNFENIVLEKAQLKEYIRKLEETKDKQDVMEMKRDVGMLSDYEIFEEKAKNLRASLKKVDSYIVTIIYNEYTYNNLHFSRNANEFKIAIADGLIDDEGYLDQHHPIINTIFSELNSLEKFFKNEMSNETYEVIDSEYPDVPLEFKNLKFWEKILGITLTYER